MSAIGAPEAAWAPGGIRREVAATIRLALPLVVGQLAIMGQNTIDVMLAGHYSAHVLGAVGIGSSLWWLAQMAGSGVLMALAPSVSQLDGARARGQVGPLFVQSLWLAAAVGLLLLALVYWGGPAVVDAMGVSPDLRHDIAGFLRIAAFGAPAVTMFVACRGLSEGLSMPGPSMAMGVLGLVLLPPLGYGLIYGGFGLPRLEARGSALAQVAVCWVQLACFLCWLRWSGRFRGLGWDILSLGPRWGAIGGLLRVGGPVAAGQILESSLFCASALVVGRFGPAAAGSHQVALIVAAMTFMVPLGLAFAVTVRVGNATGRGDRAGVRRAGLAGIGLGLAAQFVAASAMLTAPASIASLYTTDPEVQARAAVLLRLAGVFQLSDGLQVVAQAALRGMRDTKIPMLISGISYWCVGMPVGLAFAFAAGLETPGMWIGMIAGLTVAAALLLERFLRLTRVNGAWIAGVAARDRAS